MNKPNVVIIEDEIPAARLPHSMVSGLRPQWTLIMVLGNVDGIVAWFHEHPHPDLIFLDTHPADENVFNFLSVVHPSSIVISTTAYDQYAICIFMVNSTDYIFKSIDEKCLPEAVMKYESLLNNEAPRPEDYLDVLLETFQHKKKRYRTHFLTSEVDRSWSLQVADIAYLYSGSKMTSVVTWRSREHIIDLSLNKLTEQLDPRHFLRANRQVLVGIDAIDRAEPFSNGRIVITARPPYELKITVSEEKLSVFKLWLNHREDNY